MSARYFTRRAPKAQTRSDEWWDNEGLTLINLSVPGHEAADTGILDVNGEAIMRAPNPMGFIWEEYQ